MAVRETKKEDFSGKKLRIWILIKNATPLFIVVWDMERCDEKRNNKMR